MLVWIGWVGVGVIGVLLAITASDALLRPAMRRLAMRQLNGRPFEGALVVLGSSLGTAIITASLLVGSTFQFSLRDGARTTLGPIDEVVTVQGRITPPTWWGKVAGGAPLAGTDGRATALVAPGTFTATHAGGTVRAEPEAEVAEADLGALRALGGDPAATGLAGAATPSGDGVVINRKLARKLGARTGSTISLHAYQRTSRFRVRRVVPEVGVAGRYDAFVPLGTMARVLDGTIPVSATPPAIVLLVSNRGGVFDSAGQTDTVVSAVRARLTGQTGFEVATVKRDLLRDATDQGHQIGQLFTGVGAFSVLAGVLLLVNLFVMLAEERRRELGMARALGMKRVQVMRLFAIEGAAHAVLASFVGVAGGVGVGWLIVEATKRIFRHGDQGFTLRFSAPSPDLAIAGGVGLGIALLTVWITSGRVANLNVVRALRGLPEPPREGHHLRSSLPASLGVAAGGVVTGVGLVGPVPAAALLGPPIVLFSAIPLVRPVLGRRTTTAFLALAALLWCAGVFAFLPRVAHGAGIPVFIVQGIVMVGAAVTVATSIDHAWVALAEHVTRTGHGLAARLGLAYPLARLFRTAMLLAMYALIIFTLTFIAVYGRIISSQAHTFTNEIRAGYDLRVDSNPAEPVAVAELARRPGVAAVAPLVQSGPDFTASFEHTPTQWGLTGFDGSLLRFGVPTLAKRASRFASDAAAFRGVLADPGLVVVDSQFLSTPSSGRPESNLVGIGDRVTAIAPGSGQRRTLTVVGIVDHDIAEVGAYASASSVRSLMGSFAVANRSFVRVDRGADPGRVAASLNADLVARGVDAKTFRALVDRSIATEIGFLQLIQGYLSVGLVVGIAGLGVVMVRAVRDRVRQIGMLRAIGFSAEIVRRAFLAEAAFIAAQGIAIGVVLGLITSYQMLTRSATLGGQTLPYEIPWATLGLLVLIPFAASLAAVVVPASRAAAVHPAEVLRRAD